MPTPFASLDDYYLPLVSWNHLCIDIKKKTYCIDESHILSHLLWLPRNSPKYLPKQVY